MKKLIALISITLLINGCMVKHLVDGKKGQLSGSAGAMWSTVSGKAGVNFKIPFTDIKVKCGAKGHAGALGASAKGSAGKGGIKGSVDIAVGLGGGGYFDVSW